MASRSSIAELLNTRNQQDTRTAIKTLQSQYLPHSAPLKVVFDKCAGTARATNDTIVLCDADWESIAPSISFDPDIYTHYAVVVLHEFGHVRARQTVRNYDALTTAERERIANEFVYQFMRIENVWHGDIEKETIDNARYRAIIKTTQHSQLVYMHLKPHQQIPTEVHDNGDQFIRVERGDITVTLEGMKRVNVPADHAIIIPAGTTHLVVAGAAGADLYTIYSPPQH
jgi:quercetin dioxygenase-like cupin family protein